MRSSAVAERPHNASCQQEQFQAISEDVFVRNILMHSAH